MSALAWETSWCVLTSTTFRLDAGRLLTTSDGSDRHGGSGHRTGFNAECDLFFKRVCRNWVWALVKTRVSRPTGPFQLYAPLFPIASELHYNLDWVNINLYAFIYPISGICWTNWNKQRIKTKQHFRVQPPITNSTYGNVTLWGSHTFCKRTALSCFFEQSFRLPLPLGYGIFYFILFFFLKP